LRRFDSIRNARLGLVILDQDVQDLTKSTKISGQDIDKNVIFLVIQLENASNREVIKFTEISRHPNLFLEAPVKRFT